LVTSTFFTVLPFPSGFPKETNEVKSELLGLLDFVHCPVF
jgi:hypothetical protein